MPNTLITPFELPAVNDVWIRVVGMLLVLLAFYDIQVRAALFRTGEMDMQMGDPEGGKSAFPQILSEIPDSLLAEPATGRFAKITS